MYGNNLDQLGPKKANLDQLGQAGRHFAVFCLLRKAPLTNLDQVGPVLFPTVFRALPKIPEKKRDGVREMNSKMVAPPDIIDEHWRSCFARVVAIASLTSSESCLSAPPSN